MGVRDMDQFLERWDVIRMYRACAGTDDSGAGAPGAGRWYALWLLTQGWTAQATAEALERDPHTIGRWASAFGEGGPAALIFEQTGGSPPPLGSRRSRRRLKGAVQELPANSGIGLANWNWKVVCQYVSERFGISLSRSTCLNYLRRLGFSFKRPKKRLLKADMEKREVCVAEYAAWAFQAQKAGEKVFFADEAHFRADPPAETAPARQVPGPAIREISAQLVHSSSLFMLFTPLEGWLLFGRK